MAFGDIIQAEQAVGYPVTSVTVNIASAVSGNLLVLTHFTGATNTIAPSGFSEAVSEKDGGNNDEISIYYKISTGGETSVIANSDASDDQMAAVIEIEGPWESSPVDVTASNDATTESSTSSGTTGTTSQDDEVAVACISVRSSSVPDSFTNSFVVREEVAGSYKAQSTATKLLTATGTQETTASHTSTVGMGLIATFKKQAAGGANPKGPLGMPLLGALGGPI